MSDSTLPDCPVMRRMQVGCEKNGTAMIWFCPIPMDRPDMEIIGIGSAPRERDSTSGREECSIHKELELAREFLLDLLPHIAKLLPSVQLLQALTVMLRGKRQEAGISERRKMRLMIATP